MVECREMLTELAAYAATMRTGLMSNRGVGRTPIGGYQATLDNLAAICTAVPLIQKALGKEGLVLPNGSRLVVSITSTNVFPTTRIGGMPDAEVWPVLHD